MNKKLSTAFLTLMALGAWNLAQAGSINEVEPNDTIGTAQNIDGYFSVGVNADIQDALMTPWVSIAATGDGTYDYYSFTAGAGAIGYFDTDYTSFDTQLWLFDGFGTALDGNDDSAGDPGSSSGLDSFFDYTFASAGTYVIGVCRFFCQGPDGGMTGDAPAVDAAYTLQVSISSQDVPDVQDVPEPGILALLGMGLAGFGFARSRKAKV